MRPESRMFVAILALRTHANAVGQRRLETIEVGAHDIYALIDTQARQVLPYASAHDAGLAVMYGETLFVQNCGHMCGEPLGAALKFLPSRKRQIVSIARVLGARRFRQ